MRVDLNTPLAGKENRKVSNACLILDLIRGGAEKKYTSRHTQTQTHRMHALKKGKELQLKIQHVPGVFVVITVAPKKAREKHQSQES